MNEIDLIKLNLPNLNESTEPMCYGKFDELRIIMKFLRVSQVSELTGLHPSSLRRMHKSGELVPEKVTAGGTRYYSEERIFRYLKGECPNNRAVKELTSDDIGEESQTDSNA
ncbi:MerR family transcriptional regulator [Bacillus cereus]|nr:MerR family transcriptional regulator [Bacillus cereus]